MKLKIKDISKRMRDKSSVREAKIEVTLTNDSIQRGENMNVIDLPSKHQLQFPIEPIRIL